MTASVGVSYDGDVQKRYPQPTDVEKAGRGGLVDVRSSSEFAGSNGCAPPTFFVVLRFGAEVELFSIADLMNRPPRKYR